jgi:ketosteroid isomerase-like protein
MFTEDEGLSCTSQEGQRRDRCRGAAEQGDEADEAFGGMVASMDMPPHARAACVWRGHRFAAYPRCSVDYGGGGVMAIGRRTWFMGVMLLLCSALGWSKAATDDADGDAVLQRDEEMAQAVVAGDLKRLEDIYAPDYVYVGSEGKQITRAERLEAFRTGRLRYLATKHSGTSVRMYGETALVQGQTHSKVLSSGREIEGDFRYVGIWVRQGGKWRIVLTQATRIAG